MSDKALAEYRKARAVELRLAGMEYAEIAREVGYANKGTAWKAANGALRERTDQMADEYLETELARLDALQAASWEDAMAGDTTAIHTVLKVMGHRMRLLGLDRIEQAKQGPKCVVLSPDELAEWERSKVEGN